MEMDWVINVKIGKDDSRSIKNEKFNALKQADHVMMGRWDRVDAAIVTQMRQLLPENVYKNVAYDLIKNPSRKHLWRHKVGHTWSHYYAGWISRRIQNF